MKWRCVKKTITPYLVVQTVVFLFNNPSGLISRIHDEEFLLVVPEKREKYNEYF